MTHPIDSWNPGITKPKLTKEPLGTEGELTPGPDELRPSHPDERDELVERGYFSPEAVDEDEGDDIEVPPLFGGTPPAMPKEAPFNLELDADLPKF